MARDGPQPASEQRLRCSLQQRVGALRRGQPEAPRPRVAGCGPRRAYLAEFCPGQLLAGSLTTRAGHWRTNLHNYTTSRPPASLFRLVVVGC